MFAAVTERATWAGVRAFARVAPNTCLRMMLGSLSTRPAGEVLGALGAADRAMLLALRGEKDRPRECAGFTAPPLRPVHGW